MKNKKNKTQFRLNKKLTFFLTLLLAGLFGLDIFIIWVIFDTSYFAELSPYLSVVIVLSSTYIIGSILSGFITKYILKDLEKLAQSMEIIANGDYSVRLKLDTPTDMINLSDCFNKMAEQLSSTEILKNDFINNFSHEFKTPISSIKGYIKLLKNCDLQDIERQRYIDIISTEINRLSELSNNTLLLSRLNLQENIGETATVYLDEILKQSILLMEKDITQKQLTLEMNLEPTKTNCNVDLMRQVFINMLSNAIKYCNTGDSIIISTKCLNEKNGVQIIFEDTGIGMDEETQKHIFEKYFQGDTSHSTNGVGLGLSIVKKIINLHKGKIEVSSQPNKGSKFIITLS